jgi:hypothetical protein
MTFKSQQENWEALAETDPLWAVLSEPEKRGNLWDVGEFYRSGWTRRRRWSSSCRP